MESNHCSEHSASTVLGWEHPSTDFSHVVEEVGVDPDTLCLYVDYQLLLLVQGNLLFWKCICCFWADLPQWAHPSLSRETWWVRRTEHTDRNSEAELNWTSLCAVFQLTQTEERDGFFKASSAEQMHTKDLDVSQTVDFRGYVYHLFIDVSMSPNISLTLFLVLRPDFYKLLSSPPEEYMLTVEN